MKQHNPPNNTVRVGPLMYMPAVLRELGHDLEPLFRGSGYTPAQFEDPDTELLYAPASQLLARCVAAAGCEHFGLLVGMRAGASCLGLVGFLTLNAPDVGTALRELAEHLDLHDRGGVPVLLIRGEVTLLGYAIHQANVAAADYIYDISIAQVCNIMRNLCGTRWNPTEVLLSREPPRDPAPYRRFYQAPVRFNAEQNAVVFPTRLLGKKIPRADDLLHRYLEREAGQVQKLRSCGIVSELRGLLRKSLLTGECSVRDIARQLCLHQRTLHRRLREQGTSFSQELDDIRQQMAQQLLAESTMAIGRIATGLNYANVSAFNRAFKRWTGITPAQWRKRHKGG